MTPPPDRRGPPQPPKGGGVPSRLSDSRRGPSSPPGPRPPGVGPGSGRGPAPRAPEPQHPATEHPATQPPRPASRGPAPAGPGPKKPAPGKHPKDDPRAAPPSFEIRRGRANPDADGDDDGPMGPVVLPRSITQDAEEERLKERFGVDHLPAVKEVNSLVRMTESQGTLGPDRARRRVMTVVLVLLLVAGGAVFVLHKQGMLRGVLGGP